MTWVLAPTSRRYHLPATAGTPAARQVTGPGLELLCGWKISKTTAPEWMEDPAPETCCYNCRLLGRKQGFLK